MNEQFDWKSGIVAIRGKHKDQPALALPESTMPLCGAIAQLYPDQAADVWQAIKADHEASSGAAAINPKSR